MCFECFSNIEWKNEGIISEATTAIFGNALSRWANQQINDGRVLRLAYDDGKTCTSGNYRCYIYSMANVMQHEREAFINVGALMNAAAGEHVVIFVNGNF